MWTFLRKILARSKILNAALGEVVFETPEVTGQNSRSFLQWRVKKDVGGNTYFVGLRMLPDAYAGSEGSPTNYMNFDVESAKRLRFHLDRCIGEYYRLTRTIPPQATNLAE
jgi:hypothetical protein